TANLPAAEQRLAICPVRAAGRTRWLAWLGERGDAGDLLGTGDDLEQTIEPEGAQHTLNRLAADDDEEPRALALAAALGADERVGPGGVHEGQAAQVGGQRRRAAVQG